MPDEEEMLPPPPILAIMVRKGEREERMAETLKDGKTHTQVVRTHLDELWQVGSPIPDTDKTPAAGADGKPIAGTAGSQTIMISALVKLEDGSVDVYGLPIAGSEMDKRGGAIIINIAADLVKQTTTIPALDEWKDLLDEAQNPYDDPEPEPAVAPANGVAASETGAGAAS